ncbi:hypothetical protein ABPG75_000775 [Micractinium tetrahymenae]
MSFSTASTGRAMADSRRRQTMAGPAPTADAGSGRRQTTAGAFASSAHAAFSRAAGTISPAKPSPLPAAADASKRRMTMAGPAPAASSATSKRRETMAGPAPSKPASRLARLLTGKRSPAPDASSTGSWTIGATPAPAAPQNTCTDIVHSNQCTDLIPYAAPTCTAIIPYPPPCAPRLPAALLARTAAPAAAAAAEAATAAAAAEPAVAAEPAADCWLTLDMEITAEEAQCLVQLPTLESDAAPARAARKLPVQLAQLSRAMHTLAAKVAGKLASFSCLAKPAVAS